jgi:hypothetical protein
MASNAGSAFMSTSERGNYFYSSNNTFANSTHSHGNPTLALTNLTGTTASASNGFTLSLSAAAPGAGGGAAISAAGASASNGTVVFSNGNGVSFGMAGSTVTASVNAGVAGGQTAYYLQPFDPFRLTTMMNFSQTGFTNRVLCMPFTNNATDIVANTIRLYVSGAASSSRSLGGTYKLGIYSAVNSTSMSLIASDSMAFSITDSAASTVWNGFRGLDFTNFSSLTLTAPGYYAMGLLISNVSDNAAWANMILFGGDTFGAHSGFLGYGTSSAIGSASNFVPFWGAYNTTTADFPGGIGLSQVAGGMYVSAKPYYFMIKQV